MQGSHDLCDIPKDSWQGMGPGFIVSCLSPNLKMWLVQVHFCVALHPATLFPLHDLSLEMWLSERENWEEFLFFSVSCWNEFPRFAHTWLGPRELRGSRKRSEDAKGELGVGFVSYSRKLVSETHKGSFKYILDLGSPSLNAKEQYHSANR